MPPREALEAWQAGGNAMADGEKPLVRFDVVDGVGVITVDNPPVNALGPGVRDGVKAMVMIGAGRGT